MNDTPNNHQTIHEILNHSEFKYDVDVVVLDLTTLYMLRPTYTKLPTSLGISIPSDLSDAFDTIFIKSMIEALVEHSIAVTKTDDILTYIEDNINGSLQTTYMFDRSNSDTDDYIVNFYVTLKELVDRHIVGYTNIGNMYNFQEMDNVDRFYTINDLNVYINNDRTHMQLVLRMWTRSLAWN